MTKSPYESKSDHVSLVPSRDAPIATLTKEIQITVQPSGSDAPTAPTSRSQADPGQLPGRGRLAPSPLGRPRRQGLSDGLE